MPTNPREPKDPLAVPVPVPIDRANWRKDILSRFAKKPVWFGIDCGRDLLCDLFDALDGTGSRYEVEQIKQKWGTLRVYIDDASSPVLQAMIDEAETKSEKVCEECGRPGTLRQRPTGVRCDTCRDLFGTGAARMQLRQKERLLGVEELYESLHVIYDRWVARALDHATLRRLLAAVSKRLDAVERRAVEANHLPEEFEPAKEAFRRWAGALLETPVDLWMAERGQTLHNMRPTIGSLHRVFRVFYCTCCGFPPQ